MAYVEQTQKMVPLIACPAHPGSLDMISMTFAAVICDADDPCSVNTA